MNVIANIISTLLSPPAWVVFFLFAASRQGLFLGKLNSQEKLFILALFSIPLLYLMYQWKTKKVSDIDMSKREERYKTIVMLNLCLAGVVVYFFILNLQELFRLTLIFFLINSITSLITFKYKISFHMTYALTFAVVINHIYGYALPWLYLSLPLIFWSRWYLKHHTIPQMLLAAVIDGIILYIFLR